MNQKWEIIPIWSIRMALIVGLNHPFFYNYVTVIQFKNYIRFISFTSKVMQQKWSKKYKYSKWGFVIMTMQVGIGHNFHLNATGWKWKLSTCLGGDGISQIRNKTSIGVFPGFDLRIGWRAEYILPEIHGWVSPSSVFFWEEVLKVLWQYHLRTLNMTKESLMRYSISLDWSFFNSSMRSFFIIWFLERWMRIPLDLDLYAH